MIATTIINSTSVNPSFDDFFMISTPVGGVQSGERAPARHFQHSVASDMPD